MSSVTRNTCANFIGLAYTMIVGVVVLPLYLQYLGDEGFGLVGLFLMLQAWMQIFDLGMSPLLSREVARARGLKAGFLQLQRLLRSLEVIMFVIAVLLFLCMLASRDWISSQWLNIGELPVKTVSTCLLLMALVACLRLLASPYKSWLQGLERQVCLNVTNVVFATLKFIGAWLLVKYFTQDIIHFFTFQLIVGIMELACVSILCYQSIPSAKPINFSVHWTVLRPSLPFAFGMAYLTTIWIFLSQTDKLVLSNVLPLKEFGYFTMATVIAAGISQMGTPISQAILPRMTFLLSQNKEPQMLLLYHQSSQLMASLIVPLTLIVAFFAEELVFVWTGDKSTANWIGPILFWLALGNGLMALGAFQYYLQFAHGQLRLHIIFSTAMACVQVPVIVYTAHTHGVYTMAVVWFGLRLLSFTLWTPFVHHVFAPGIHLKWLITDIGPSVLMTFLVASLFLIADLPLDVLGRGQLLLVLTAAGLVMLVASALASTTPRALLHNACSRT